MTKQVLPLGEGAYHDLLSFLVSSAFRCTTGNTMWPSILHCA
jgi:hypothetical protein